MHPNIPHGIYCHGQVTVVIDEYGKQRFHTITCPYWSERAGPNGNNNVEGYCSLLNKGDGDTLNGREINHLWDQVKECGINEEEEC